ncbi:MAG: tRNA methyltransferase, partial [Archaeoglobi archaeon]|nr:tRNA methyltransferase [Archaeoglobi archaeon]
SREPVTEFRGKRYDEEVRKCLRIHPQDNDTEGFFVAKVVKPDE